jgi:hypothetical protein
MRGARAAQVVHVLRRHHEGPGDVLLEDLQGHLADADRVSHDELRPLDLLAVDVDAIGTSRVSDGDPVGPRLEDRVAARALGVVQDQVARRVPSEHGDGPRQLDLVLCPGRIADLESHGIPCATDDLNGF